MGKRDSERLENSPVDCFQRAGAGRPKRTGMALAGFFGICSVIGLWKMAPYRRLQGLYLFFIDANSRLWYTFSVRESEEKFNNAV